MDRDNVDQMWKIIKESNFQINNDINSDCLCMICKKLLIDACNAPCGCRYCEQCAREYLYEERKVCTGTSEYCKNEISELVMKCPNISCKSNVELKTMENHLRICDHRFLRCPYFNVACGEEKPVNLLSEIDPHSKLLMEWITNYQNDSESLKKEMQQLIKDNKEMKGKIGLNEERAQNQREDMDRLKSENNEIKERVGRSENIIRNLHKLQRENLTEIHILGEEMSALKNDNRSLKEELQVIKTENIYISELRTKVEKQIKEIDKLKQKLHDKYKIQEKQCKDIEMKLDEISQNKDAYNSESEKSIKILREIVDQSNHGEFIWRIENWAEKQTQAQNGIKADIYSGEFFTHKNGYKMCLELDPDGDGDGKGTHLSLGFCIRRGPFDDVLQWPFKHDMDLSLIDQQSGDECFAKTVKYSDAPEFSECFMKPMCEGNLGIGDHQFMKLSEISANPALIRSNQIFIKCQLSKPS